MATHNRPELLRLTLESVRTQDYRGEIECMVVFDQCDPDTTLERLGSGDPKRSLKVVTNTRTPGLAGARNTGIEASTGELVAFCDDDDLWRQGKVRLQVADLEASDALTSVTGIRVVYAGQLTVRIPKPSEVTLGELARRRTMEAHPSSVMVRRDALLGPIGLVDEEIPGSYGEDFDWILRAARAGRIAVVERPLVDVRWGQSLFSRNWQVIIDAIDYLLAKHPELRESRQGKARLLGRRAFALAALGHRKEALDQATATVRLSWRERRAYLAGLVALRLVSAERLMGVAHKRGRGI